MITELISDFKVIQSSWLVSCEFFDLIIRNLKVIIIFTIYIYI